MTNGEDRIDALIDDVAGRMTEGAPAADFTARVLRRIDEPQPRLRWHWVWVAGPLAAAAVVLIALQVGRVKPPLDVAGANGSSVVRLKPDTTRDKPDTTEAKADAADTRPRAARRTQNVAEDRRASTIDALAPPRLDVAPLDVTPLEAGVTSPESIEIEHLETIAPIAVTPLGADSQGRL